MTANDAIQAVCENDRDRLPWAQWLSAFNAAGITVTDDDSGFMESKMLSAEEAKSAIARCTIKFKPPEDMDDSVEVATVEVVKPATTAPKKTLTVSEWRRAYDQVAQNPPIGKMITAEEGPIRLEIELNPGQPPFIYSRAYIRNVVGEIPDWFAQGAKQTNSFGWKLVLLNKSRDEVIRKLGVSKNVIFVKTIHVMKMSDSRRALLGEVVEW